MLTPIQLFDLFIDDDIVDWIVDCTIDYARTDCNEFMFTTDANEMRQFIGILFMTGYNTRPQIENYWSTNPSLQCELIRGVMTRDRFKRLKRFIHVCNNRRLDKHDKFAKVTPLNDFVNNNFMRFGVFSHNLSIDEQMIAYYGRHSCKMFIRGKPIRFGFKYWNLCSSDGYCYAFIPYGGASATKDPQYEGLGLGETVVLKLLSHLQNPSQHCVAFDNFFTSHQLMCRLSSLNYFATGTIRENRTSKATLTDPRSMRKKERGAMDHAFDKNNEILMVRWNDNAVVTVASNHEPIEPMHRAKRWDKKHNRMGSFDMPQLIHANNKRMGGVDLFDNAMNNYRIRVRGKKWYWPLVTNALDAAMVNAWKFQCAMRDFEATKFGGKVEPMSQLDFRVYVTECLCRQTRVLKFPNPTKLTGMNALNEIRMDMMCHSLEKIPKPRRCQHCHKHASYICKKCDIILHQKCFNVFHNM